jgi:hypothetical protein
MQSECPSSVCSIAMPYAKIAKYVLYRAVSGPNEFATRSAEQSRQVTYEMKSSEGMTTNMLQMLCERKGSERRRLVMPDQ